MLPIRWAALPPPLYPRSLTGRRGGGSGRFRGAWCGRTVGRHADGCAPIDDMGKFNYCMENNCILDLDFDDLTASARLVFPQLVLHGVAS